MAVIADPLATLRDARREFEDETKKHVASFLRQYPQCGSKRFNGALVLYGRAIRKGVATVLEIREAGYNYRDLSIVLKENRVLLLVCHHEGLHAACRDKQPLDLFNKSYRRYMGAALRIDEFT
jgi:hypothetical protein